MNKYSELFLETFKEADIKEFKKLRLYKYLGQRNFDFTKMFQCALEINNLFLIIDNNTKNFLILDFPYLNELYKEEVLLKSYRHQVRRIFKARLSKEDIRIRNKISFAELGLNENSYINKHNSLHLINDKIVIDSNNKLITTNKNIFNIQDPGKRKQQEIYIIKKHSDITNQIDDVTSYFEKGFLLQHLDINTVLTCIPDKYFNTNDIINVYPKNYFEILKKHLVSYVKDNFKPNTFGYIFGSLQAPIFDNSHTMLLYEIKKLSSNFDLVYNKNTRKIEAPIAIYIDLLKFNDIFYKKYINIKDINDIKESEILDNLKENQFIKTLISDQFKDRIEQVVPGYRNFQLPINYGRKPYFIIIDDAYKEPLYINEDPLTSLNLSGDILIITQMGKTDLGEPMYKFKFIERPFNKYGESLSIEYYFSSFGSFQIYNETIKYQFEDIKIINPKITSKSPIKQKAIEIKYCPEPGEPNIIEIIFEDSDDLLENYYYSKDFSKALYDILIGIGEEEFELKNRLKSFINFLNPKFANLYDDNDGALDSLQKSKLSNMIKNLNNIKKDIEKGSIVSLDDFPKDIEEIP